MIVTIDGLSGSKKTPTAAEFARRTGFHHINSGVLFRSLAELLLEADVFPESRSEWSEASEYIRENIFVNQETATLSNRLGEDSKNSCCKTYEKGENAKRDYLKSNKNLFSHRIGSLASQLASIKRVRILAVQAQRELAEGRNVIVDGRDAGSVVFPRAKYKFWFYADPQSRAEWRYMYEVPNSEDRNEEERAAIIKSMAADIVERDTREVERDVSPLEVVENATKILVTRKSVEVLASELIRTITQDDPLFKIM